MEKYCFISYNFHVTVMNSNTPCDCNHEQHKGKNVNHKHIEDECVHEDS